MRFRLRTLLLGALAITGAGFFPVGGVPMIRAVAVSGNLLDNGVDPGDQAIMDKWDSWAFTYQNFALVICGSSLMAWSIRLALSKGNRQAATH